LIRLTFHKYSSQAPQISAPNGFIFSILEHILNIQKILY